MHQPALPTYLHHHRSTFHFRYAVPHDLRPLLGQWEIRRSLTTDSPRKARPMAAQLALVVYDALTIIRRKALSMDALTIGQLQDWARTYLRDKLEVAARELELNTPEDRHSASDGYWEDFDAVHEWFSKGDYAQFAKPVNAFIEAHGLDINPDTPEYSRLAHHLMRAHLDFTRIAAQRAGHNFSDTIPSPFMSPVPRFVLGDPIRPQASSSRAKPNLTISEAVEQYTVQQIRLEKWTEKSEKDCRPKLTLFAQLTGDPPCNQLASAHILDYKDSLQRLPSNREKRPAYRGKGIETLLNLKIPKDHLLTPTTIAIHYTQVTGFLRWLSLSKLTTEAGLADILKAATPGRKKKHGDKLLPYGPADLQRIFSAPSYTKDRFRHAYQFWLPILGLYTGARIEEICQLGLHDIKQVDGIWVFDINQSEGHSVKTSAGIRQIPLHDALVNSLHLIAYRDKVLSGGHSRFFYELSPGGKDRYSHDASKWFGRFKTELGFSKTYNFHTFRRTFVNVAKQKLVKDAMLKEIVGHEVSDITFGLYANRYSVPILKAEVIDKLDFGVDLSSLAESRFVVRG